MRKERATPDLLFAPVAPSHERKICRLRSVNLLVVRNEATLVVYLIMQIKNKECSDGRLRTTIQSS